MTRSVESRSNRNRMSFREARSPFGPFDLAQCPCDGAGACAACLCRIMNLESFTFTSIFTFTCTFTFESVRAAFCRLRR